MEDCNNCHLLKDSQAKIERLEKEGDTMLAVTDFLMTVFGCWAKYGGQVPSSPSEEVEQELHEWKERIRVSLKNLTETGEPAFLDGFFNDLHLTEFVKQLL